MALAADVRIIGARNDFTSGPYPATESDFRLILSTSRTAGLNCEK